MTDASANGALTRQDPFLSLAARLVDPVDRDSYAELVVWLRSLPPQDEMVKLAQLLGFLTLIARDLPEALAAGAIELRELSQTNATYHRSLHERLSKLPDEIAAGVDPEELAEAMSERFRQQLSATGLEDTAQLLYASVVGLSKLSGQLAESLKPITNQYAGIGATVSAELTKLTNASAQVRQHNANLVAQAAEDRWQWKALFCLVLLCVGFVFGLIFEKRSTTDVVVDLQGQVTQILQKLTTESPGAEATPIAPRRRRSGK